jgi:hypothetical protein
MSTNLIFIMRVSRMEEGRRRREEGRGRKENGGRGRMTEKG